MQVFKEFLEDKISSIQWQAQSDFYHSERYGGPSSGFNAGDLDEQLADARDTAQSIRADEEAVFQKIKTVQERDMIFFVRWCKNVKFFITILFCDRLLLFLRSDF